MFSRHFDSAQRLFEDQFEADGPDFIYRKSMKGAAVRVIAAEKRQMVATFNRQSRQLFWAFLITVVLAIPLPIFFLSEAESSDADPIIYPALAALIGAYMWGLYRVWDAPARFLERRTPIASALSSAERRELLFSSLTYRQLGMAALVAPLILWRASVDHDVLQGWGRLWLVLAFGLLTLCGVQAFRKWRFDVEGRRPRP